MAPEVVTNLGALHRAGTWENIILNVGLTSKGIQVKPTPPSSPLGRTPNQSTTHLPDGDRPVDVNSGLDQPEADLTGTFPAPLSQKSDGPREQNSVALKHMTHGLPSSLSPFFQGKHLFLPN